MTQNVGVIIYNDSAMMTLSTQYVGVISYQLEVKDPLFYHNFSGDRH